MFDPRDFHGYAVRCAEGVHDEAACRTAISRAYYAAYLVAYAHVQRKGIRAEPQPGKRLGPHERTINALATIRQPGAQFMAEELGKLKRRRIDADYDMGYTDASRHMQKVLQDAAMIIDWIDTLP